MGVRVDVNREVNFFVKIQKHFFWGGVGGRLGGGGGQGGCERRIEVFVKIKKKNWGGGESGEGGQGRGVRGGRVGGGVRVNVNIEVKFL